jgi:hypothetical protein
MKKLTLSLLIISTILLCGCWDSVEINKREYLFAVGIDKKEDKLNFISEIPKINEGSEEDRLVYSNEGESFADFYHLNYLHSDKVISDRLMQVIVLIAGVFMETSSAIILITPVFLPLIRMLGIDLIHFGLIFTIGIAIGMITPPVAIDLFVASSVTGMPIERIAKKVMPYLIGLIIAFFIYIYLPLFIPSIIL